MDGLAGLWPYFGQLVAMQVRAWLVARPQGAFAVDAIGARPGGSAARRPLVVQVAGAAPGTAAFFSGDQRRSS